MAAECRFVKLAVASLVLSSLAIPARLACQPPLADQAPTSNSPVSNQTPVPSPSPAPATTTERPVSWKLLIPNLIHDQERIWTFPVRLAQGQSLIPAVAVAGTTAGLVAALDPEEGRYFRGTSTFNGFNNIFTSNATTIGMIVAPVAFYAAGSIRKDAKMTRTALFAGEAVADAEVVTTVLKDITRRARPETIPPSGDFSDSWFKSSGSFLRGNGSFPSGHTIAAFSVATVIARRYGNHRWVPYAAYGMAAVVGFSRLTLSAHFTSDVFMGAALGYSISRFTVLRQ